MGLYKDKWEFFAKDELKLTNKIDKKDDEYKKSLILKMVIPGLGKLK